LEHEHVKSSAHECNCNSATASLLMVRWML